MAQVYWGDLHNHNEIGYGQGSLARAIEIARSHLDFFAFTPHGQWFDEANTGPQVHEKHRRGFAIVREKWPYVRQTMNAAYCPGKFVTFLAHEWHSSQLGDYHIIYPGPDHQITYFSDIHELQRYVRRQGAIMIPHHCAYSLGSRGTNWQYFDSEVSPVAEIFSEHGSSECDWGPWAMTGHSMGPASTTQTIRHALDQGKVFGFTASSDDHFGCPGAYGEGLTAVFADSLTREAIFAAIKARRTYAVTGDRIKLDFRVNDAPMGSIVPESRRRLLTVRVEGEDELRAVDLVKNGKEQSNLLCLPSQARAVEDSTHLPEYKLRVEWGWGGMEDADVFDWSLALHIEEGEIVSATPHFQSAPFDEHRRNRIVELNDHSCVWQSYTSRRGPFRGIPTNSLVFVLKAPPRALIRVDAEKPHTRRVEVQLGELLATNHVERMSQSFTAPTLLLHKAMRRSRLVREWHLEDTPERNRDYYYVRVLQNNNHMAWSSPIWVGGGH